MSSARTRLLTATSLPSVPLGEIEEVTAKPAALDDFADRARDDPGYLCEIEVVEALADLSDADFERRLAELKPLGRSVSISRLRAAVAKHQRGSGSGPMQGRRLSIPSPEPWADRVIGRVVLDELVRLFSRHVILPEGAADVLALWAALTYCFDLFGHSPRLAITSPEKRCGKTTLLDVLALVVARSLPVANVSTAALFRTIEIATPTLLVDEADRFLSRNEELVGIMNAGHKRGGAVVRCVGDDSEPARFEVFSPLVIAAIGTIPDTLADRAIEIRMRRARVDERPAPIDRLVERDGHDLGRKLARWALDNGDALRDADPKLPGHLFNRTADNHRPLFVVAKVVGGDWPDRIEEAERALARETEEEDDRLPILLLRSIRTIFAAEPNPDRVVIPSADLLNDLIAMEEQPWSSMPLSHRELSSREMARMLKTFRIKSFQLRDENGRNRRHFHAAAFADAFERYLPADEAPASQTLPAEEITGDVRPPSPPRPAAHHHGRDRDEDHARRMIRASRPSVREALAGKLRRETRQVDDDDQPVDRRYLNGHARP